MAFTKDDIDDADDDFMGFSHEEVDEATKKVLADLGQSIDDISTWANIDEDHNDFTKVIKIPMAMYE